jgi:hypothetical protein
MVLGVRYFMKVPLGASAAEVEGMLARPRPAA